MFSGNTIDLSLLHVMECSRFDEPYHAFSPILTGFDKSEKFRAVIYFNFGVLLQEKEDFTPETEYAAPISIYHSLDDAKKGNFKILY